MMLAFMSLLPKFVATLNDCCCAKRALKVLKRHNFVTIQDTDMYVTSF